MMTRILLKICVPTFSDVWELCSKRESVAQYQRTATFYREVKLRRQNCKEPGYVSSDCSLQYSFEPDEVKLIGGDADYSIKQSTEPILLDAHSIYSAAKFTLWSWTRSTSNFLSICNHPL